MDYQKIIYTLKGIYKSQRSKSNLLDIVTFSEFEFEEYTATVLISYFKALRVTIHLEYEVFIKHYSILNLLKEILQHDLNALTILPVQEVIVRPDYNKIEILRWEIQPVFTSWEIINKAQTELISQLKSTSSTFQIKNIGNTSRDILKTLAKTVFDNDKHTPKDLSVDLKENNYKNKLQSYISSELSGSANSDLRNFANAAISMIEKAIVLANSVTHKTNSEKEIAEICVSGVITVISIIYFIEKNSS